MPQEYKRVVGEPGKMGSMKHKWRMKESKKMKVLQMEVLGQEQY